MVRDGEHKTSSMWLDGGDTDHNDYGVISTNQDDCNVGRYYYMQRILYKEITSQF